LGGFRLTSPKRSGKQKKGAQAFIAKKGLVEKEDVGEGVEGDLRELVQPGLLTKDVGEETTGVVFVARCKGKREKKKCKGKEGSYANK